MNAQPARSQVEELESQVAALQQEIQELAYIASHDVNAPLRSIVWFSTRLNEQYGGHLDEQGRRYLSTILNGGQKAQALLDGLLQYSRVIRHSRADIAPCDANAIVEESIAALTGIIDTTHAKIDVSPLPEVTADAVMLQKLFTILIANSLTYTAANTAPRIAITGSKTKNGVEFTVSDNGIGIDPKFFEMIFKPMKRLHTEDEYPGLGMGLALARRIADFHNGTIQVESAVDQGARFIFTVPN